MPSLQGFPSLSAERPHQVPRAPAPRGTPDLSGTDPTGPEPTPTRVIEVGPVTAGIAVPEGRRVRFFSSSRAFDGLDGTLFRSAEQAARAARAVLRPAPRRGVVRDGDRLRAG